MASSPPGPALADPCRTGAPGPSRRASRPRPSSHRRSRAPRGHWVLVSLVMLVFAAGLTVEGYTRGVLGENSSTEPAPGRHAAAAPAAVMSGGPVIRMAGSRPRSYTMPARTVALTFDDGPDPTWTPKILAVLRHYRVPGTFFLVGAHVASDPGLVREELRDGDEVGSHTYTHANLATAGWREDFELTLTQNALAGAADVRTRLLRMPYSSEPDALTAADWRAAERAGRDGYLVVLANLDTTDWARPGVAHIVAAATPRGRRGAIIMFHDGGGDRAQTVAALPAIITQLRARGYRFTTVTGGLHLAAGDVPATARQRFAGTALVLTQQAADRAVRRAGGGAGGGERAHRDQAGPARGVRRGAPAAGAPPAAVGPARPRLPSRRLGGDPGLQRGGGHRRHHPVHGHQPLPWPDRGHRRRRRILRRHRGHRPQPAHPVCPRDQPAQLRQAGRAQPGNSRGAQRHPDPRRRRHHLPGRHHRPPGRAAGGRGRRRGQRQHQGRQPPRVPRRLAAPRVRHGIQPGPAAVRPARHDPHRAGRDRRLPAGRARRGGRGQHRHARRGHRPDHGPVPVALARRLRARRHRLDRGAVQPAPALAAALPVVLRHHAGHVEDTGARSSSAGHPAGSAGTASPT